MQVASRVILGGRQERNAISDRIETGKKQVSLMYFY
jgi:hypothetical protein